ncbi:MAG: hypothetical protein ACKVJK_09025 [Methylophagaceae bacterium]|jgi:hypothetical protein|tara:strand:- start:434 stop:730 length:297 start_codon:yes stop_codon:yes gene_type:complete
MKYIPQEDNRKYDEEARNLIRPLGTERKYELYDIVLKKQKWSNSPTRDLELAAVVKAIESASGVDSFRLDKIKNGYRSEMAATARPKDGFTKPAKKKA